MIILDAYERRARLTPGLLALAPISIVIITLGLGNYPVVASLAGLLVAIGGPFLLATIVGSFGRSAQDSLYDKWQGAPVTDLVRTRSSGTSVAQRDLWRAKLSSTTGVELLDPAGEQLRPAEADERIQAAIGQVLHLGHGGPDGLKMVASENAQYGFERNLYGFRWVGRVVSACCLIALGVVVAIERIAIGGVIAAVVLVVLFLLVWVFLPSEDRVKKAGIRYGTQLFNAIGRPNADGGDRP